MPPLILSLMMMPCRPRGVPIDTFSGADMLRRLNKVREAGFVVGDTLDLWVSELLEQEAFAAVRERRASIMNHARLDIRRESALGEAGGDIPGTGARSQSPALTKSMLIDTTMPGDVKTFRLETVDIGWHYQASVVDLKFKPLVNAHSDGDGPAPGEDQVFELPFAVAKEMLEVGTLVLIRQ